MEHQPTDPQQIQQLMQELTDILVEAGFKPAAPVGAPMPRIGGRSRVNGFWVEYRPDGGSTEESPRPGGYRGEFRVHDIRKGEVGIFFSHKNIKRFKKALKESGWHCDKNSLNNPLRTLPMSMHEEQHRLARAIREEELRPIRNEKKRARSAKMRLWSQGLDAKWAADLKERIDTVGIAEEASEGPWRSKKAGELLTMRLTLNDGSREMVWDVVPSDGSAKERFYDRDEAVKAHIALGKPKPKPTPGA